MPVFSNPHFRRFRSPTPNAGLQNTKLPKYLPPELFTRRLMLANKFDEAFQTKRTNGKVEAYNQLYGEATRLMGSEHLKVFDIKEEPQAIRDAYGNNQLGQACLLARRLVQSGARFVGDQLWRLGHAPRHLHAFE